MVGSHHHDSCLVLSGKSLRIHKVVCDGQHITNVSRVRLNREEVNTNQIQGP